MKKVTLLILPLALIIGTVKAQTLNQSAGWPNMSWTVGGAYGAGGLIDNPTTSANFTFDDDATGQGNTDIIFAESPVIDLTAANTAGENFITVEGDFSYMQVAGQGTLTIDYWDAGAMNWVTMFTLTGNTGTPADYQGCTNLAFATTSLNITGFSAAQLSGFKYRINFDDMTGWLWGFCFDSPTIKSSNCGRPEMLTATNMTTTTADLGWTDISGASTWDIEWGPEDFVQGNGTTITGSTTNPHNLTGLTPATDYDFYVRSDCGATSSGWAGPFTFTTTCAVETTPYSEGFENGVPPCITVAGTANYTWFIINGPTASANTGPDGASIPAVGNDMSYAYAEASQPAVQGDTSRLMTPWVDISGLTQPRLTFEYHMYGVDIDRLIIQVDDGNGFTNVASIVGEQQTSGAALWKTRMVDLSSFTGSGNVRIGFFAVRGADFNADIAIDDILIDESVGIEENNENIDLTVFPNPTNGLLNLSINTTDVNELAVQVLNMQGQVVYARNNFDNVSRINEQIDLSNNAKGIYFVNITSDKGVVSHKVVVQ